MTEDQRYHPLLILFEVWKLIKNTFSVIILLFVIQMGSEAKWVIYGRWIFYLVIVVSLITIVWRWITERYRLDDTSFYLEQGVFVKSKRTIPFRKIQNVNRHATLFHRIFKVTSIRFETGMTGDEAAVEFHVISRAEADRLEKYIADQVNKERVASAMNSKNTMNETETVPSDASEIDLEADQAAEASFDKVEDTAFNGTSEQTPEVQQRTLHFKPTKKEVLKASFTSLSFLVLIPIVGTLYSNVQEFIDIEEQAEGILSTVLSSWWMTTLVIAGIIVLAVMLGIVTTFLKYGNFEISSDEERIYIAKGIMEQTAFSIAKEKVQAIEITQSFIKRLLGLAEVKLVTAGSVGEAEHEVNSLYPFLPVSKVHSIIPEMLPAYEVTLEMQRLPRTSLGLRLVRPSWIWIIATALLVYFRPNLFGWNEAWWVLSASLLVCVVVWRVLDYLNCRYSIGEHFVQFKSGGFSTSLFISKRAKIIEVKVTQGILQRRLDLASIQTTNRAKPVLHHKAQDVPVEAADHFYMWYMERTQDISTLHER
ncbi:PH domain-containing protein [Paenibacillus sp. 453mf]|uniref:PH domain-containing protein n=1 Tax=Paenibacillus sp. 453mf TaxID=1761874 RepID=UPI0008F40F4E|nr:PH domain-containing protein [Paenibacillus sp. 453mf]SFS41574.1 putative membrane protein [Paenibacillus sp. 453mf]